MHKNKTEKTYLSFESMEIFNRSTCTRKKEKFFLNTELLHIHKHKNYKLIFKKINKEEGEMSNEQWVTNSKTNTFRTGWSDGIYCVKSIALEMIIYM